MVLVKSQFYPFQVIQKRLMYSKVFQYIRDEKFFVKPCLFENINHYDDTSDSL